uniref:Translocon-associated protein subunit alpha n=1 Tax=Opuntia streptacantha TaxID=393608 RepID=A0A7C9DWG6_OPUST
MAIRVFLLALLLFAAPFLQVARSQSEAEADVEVADTVQNSDLGIVNDDTQIYGDESFSPAPGVETVCVFPKNGGKLVPAGQETELLVGIKYDGEASINVVAIQASVHLPYDHRLLVQNLTAQVFNNASVPPSAQAAFSYIFAVSKYLQPGSFDLVGSIVYEIDKTPYQSTFYNGTIEVVEVGGLFSIETVFLVMLAIGLLVALGLWIHGQLQRFSKKSKKVAPKVEVGTRSTDASLDEWLQGTAFTQSQANKSKKKK